METELHDGVLVVAGGALAECVEAPFEGGHALVEFAEAVDEVEQQLVRLGGVVPALWASSAHSGHRRDRSNPEGVAWGESGWCVAVGTLRDVMWSAAGSGAGVAVQEVSGRRVARRAVVLAVVVSGVLAGGCAPGDGREMSGANPSDTAGVLVRADSGGSGSVITADVDDGQVATATREGAPKVYSNRMSGQIGELADYDLSYPQVSESPADHAVNGALEAVVAKAYSTFRAAVLEEEGAGAGASTLRGTGKVLFVDDRLLSVVFDFTTEWNDAATAQQETSTLLVDLSTGREIAVADLFVADGPWLDKLATAARANLEAQLGADTLFTEGLAADASNFRHLAVAATGVVLRFDQYQVAPGVAGTPWVDLPWSSVAGLVDPSGPIAHLVP